MSRDSETRRRPLKVLYVDDDGVSRLVADHLLAAMGHAVRGAGSAREALARLGADAFDVVLTDIHMPEIDGVALLEAVRAEGSTADLPVVAVTADVMGRAGPTFRELGFDAVLAKPLMAADLERVLAAVTAPPGERSFAAIGMAKAR